MTDAPDAAAPLAGVCVLVTRPAHQAEPLARLIAQAGGIAVRFPTLAIAPPQDLGRLLALFDRLAQFDIAIFISPNAVEQAFALLRARGQAWPADVRVACIGRGSAQALARVGIAHPIAPTERYDSDALLAHPALTDVGGRRVLVFRGEGGREHLGHTLTERGAVVTYAECYRRVPPAVDTAPLRDHLTRGTIDIVSVTSVAGLRNLHEMAGAAGRQRLARTPIVVLSEAQAAACRELGLGVTLIAAEASDAAILNAIKTWRVNRFSL